MWILDPTMCTRAVRGNSTEALNGQSEQSRRETDGGHRVNEEELGSKLAFFTHPVAAKAMTMAKFTKKT